ncbi:vesicle transport through interaction with t-SNAREs homolog 1A-like isoform X2 [Amphibalanus amphitrite]|uniref:vesicle transport through interaction with t-SNAREs homolog 1A-like isoform X1 n=1 Tax=Amphibalanus amphitrite TaxID=1232801 RepID=UPI001C912A58|nr:vesicle transport through interaction with t-SNAREs homolog 1A-like isoform X1 [Amphibalanus amphitrite]XP_043203561.1 vesicle transport through interaction with t-SNAREs homolog 1A-like isoform X2 [Amphibalanus amphitrite]
MSKAEKASAIFTEHEHGYSVLSAEITDKMNIIQGNIITGDSISGPCAELDRLMAEAEELLEQMELESRDQPERLRQTLTNRVRSYTAELRRLAKDYSNIKNRVSRRELLGGEGSLSAAEAEERMLDNTELMERTGNRLDEGYRMCLESEAVGAEILSDLSGQRETLTKTRARLRETDSELGRSGRLLSGMLHRAVQNRVLLILVGAVLLVAIGYALYVLFTR